MAKAAEVSYQEMGSTQRIRALSILERCGMARLGELRQAGITAATLARMTSAGEVVRLARGLYQLPDAGLHSQHTLAEASKLIPRGIVCLVSALAYHGLTDQMPAKVWIAIGRKDWRPRITYPPVRISRFPVDLLKDGVESHEIEGIRVPIFGVAKTVVDLFRYRRTLGDSVAVEGLREALRQRKVSAGEVARHATTAGVWEVMEPYMTALVGNA